MGGGGALIASLWATTVAGAQGVVALVVVALVVTVLRLRDRMTRLEALEDARQRDEGLGR